MSSRFQKLLAIAILSFIPVFANADVPKAKPDMSEVVRELQKIGKSGGDFKLVWWVPDEFWSVAIPDRAAADDAIKLLSPYTLVLVVDSKISKYGAFTFTGESEIREGTRIFDASGNAYVPLDMKDVSGDVKNVIGAMSPMIANAMGQLGKNIVFLVFPRKGSDGKPIVVANEPGKFHVHFSGEEFVYRLPLAAFSPKVKCANDPELFPTTYKFCPFDGTPTVSPAQ